MPGQENVEADQGTEAGKGADMADAAHQIGRHETADDEARRPGGADQAENFVRIALQRAANRQKQALEAVAEEQKQRTGQKSQDWQQVTSHCL